VQRVTKLPAGFEDLRGQTFKDRYEITEIIDAGTRRVLFAGREREGERPILLRILQPLAVHEEPTVARFGKRMGAAGRVRHPTIVAPLDSGEIFDGTFWASYERPAGAPLADAVASAGGRFAWPDARSLLLELVQGLRAAHASRVVHGTLHPSSCWIDRPTGGGACSLRLIDLGTTTDPNLEDASIESSQTINIGNDAMFTAPETMGISMGDQRSDTYLVGLLAYAFLTGRPPFESRNAFKVMTMHMQAAVPPMRELGADVTPAVEELVRALLAKQPGQRPDGMARVEQLVLGLDEDGQPQEVPADESAQSGARRARGRAKQSQGTDGPPRGAVARAAAPTPSSSGSSLNRMLPGQEIMASTPPRAPRSGHPASSGAAAATERPAALPPPPPSVVVAPTPAPMPIAIPSAMPTHVSNDPLLADGGTLMLSGNPHALPDKPLPADGGTLMLSGNPHALPDASLPADGGTLMLSGNPHALPDASLPADGGTLMLSGNALLDAPLSADGGTLMLSSDASAPLDGTVMLSGDGSSEPLEGTLLLSGRDEPKGSSSKPAGSTVASTMHMPGSAKAGTIVAPRRAGTDTARASARTQGTPVATKPSASSTLRRENLTLRANRGRNSEVWLMTLTVLAVVAGVAAGWLL